MVTVALKVAPWYTSYPVTPTLSVAAVQAKLVVVAVVPDALNTTTEGAVVSGVAVVTFTTLLLVVFPAASLANTLNA